MKATGWQARFPIIGRPFVQADQNSSRRQSVQPVLKNRLSHVQTGRKIFSARSAGRVWRIYSVLFWYKDLGEYLSVKY